MSNKGNKKNKKNKNNLKQLIIESVIIIFIVFAGYFNSDVQNYVNENFFNNNRQAKTTISFDLSSIPEYESQPYVVINNNIPDFNENDYTTEGFEIYSKLDNLGRCGVAYANICKEIMPSINTERGAIKSVYPSGWQSIKYEGIVNGDYLYNRCHLIGWQLAGEDANELNLITGTRYMNVKGMLPFEDLVADYLKEEINEDNHVLYRVTPIFDGDNLVASRGTNGGIFC